MSGDRREPEVSAAAAPDAEVEDPMVGRPVHTMPVVAVFPPNVVLPGHLVRVADRIFELDRHDDGGREQLLDDVRATLARYAPGVS